LKKIRENQILIFFFKKNQIPKKYKTVYSGSVPAFFPKHLGSASLSDNMPATFFFAMFRNKEKKWLQRSLKKTT